jgi:hypothetical protein
VCWSVVVPSVVLPSWVHSRLTHDTLAHRSLNHIIWYTVEPRFMNLIRSWRPFVTQMFINRNFSGPTVSYLIIYEKTTKHFEIQEKARRILAGMCTERKLHSNWRSSADSPSLSPIVVAGFSRHPFVTWDVFCSENLFVNWGYTIPPNQSVFSRNSDGSRSSLMMADYCWNM